MVLLLRPSVNLHRLPCLLCPPRPALSLSCSVHAAEAGEAAQAAAFVRLWGLKEAYVKARGTGINAPPGLKAFALGGWA